MQNKKIIIDGKNLNLENIAKFVYDPKIEIELPEYIFANVEKNHNFLLGQIDKKLIYGINTGFGPMASYVISSSQLENLQKNLVLSHAVGIGRPIHNNFVLAAMLVRLNTLSKGYSGVSGELIDRLKIFINHRIIPIVPEHGAVGTSGDLVQLAHIALALIGEGDAVYEGQKKPVKEILTCLNIPVSYKLKPKEGLSLINGTSAMSGVAALVCSHAERILAIAVSFGAMSLELVGGFSDSISETLHNLRPHSGQIIIAENLRSILTSSNMLQDRKNFQCNHLPEEEVRKIDHSVQEVYSFRCLAQILGPILETFQNTKKVVETEINSVTDNPIIDLKNQAFLHGGNFHGEYIANAIDQLKISLVKLTMLSERRTNFFLNHKKNGMFPPFLNLKTPGLDLALQGLQFVATSTAAHSQSLGFPHALHSISTNLDNQDVVCMGCDAALFAAKVVENAYIVLAIEIITLTQAVDFLNTSGSLSQSSQALYREIRSVFPKIEEDRNLAAQLPLVVGLLKNLNNIGLNIFL